jgi:hypothetical protein
LRDVLVYVYHVVEMEEMGEPLLLPDSD